MPVLCSDLYWSWGSVMIANKTSWPLCNDKAKSFIQNIWKSPLLSVLPEWAVATRVSPPPAPSVSPTTFLIPQTCLWIPAKFPSSPHQSPMSAPTLPRQALWLPNLLRKKGGTETTLVSPAVSMNNILPGLTAAMCLHLQQSPANCWSMIRIIWRN